MRIMQEPLSVTYFISHLPVADPPGSLRSCKNAYLHEWSVCRSNAGSIACPGVFVIHRDVMYIGFAGAKTDHSVQVGHTF